MDKEESTPQTPFTVGQFFERAKDRLKIELVAGGAGLDQVLAETAINRPGLALAGFYDYFPVYRMQVIGLAEYTYLVTLTAEERAARFELLFKNKIPGVIFTRGKDLFPELATLADKYGVPLMRTQMVTRNFVNAATIILEDLAAPRCRIHATMVEVVGLGVILEGQAGIGKSETALGLIRNGHALIADDLTELKRDPTGKLIASAVAVTRHYMEIRGLGIIYVPSHFGVASVRDEKEVDLVVTLRMMSDGDFDRSGSADLHRDFLGVSVPQVILPVAPGRDLVNVVEAVAQEYRLRFAGNFAQLDLDERIKRHHAAFAKEAMP